MEKDGDALDKWSEELLEAWARVNITKDTIPQLDWHQRQVAIWARKVLNFSEKSAKILVEQEITGRRLLLVPNAEKLESWHIPGGAALDLWAEIEKMKKSLAEPDVTSMLSQMSITPKKEKMSYEEIMESSVKKRTQNLLHEDWLSTTDQNELCRKIYQWLQKYFIGTTVRALFTNNSLDKQTQSFMRADLQRELPLKQRDKELDQVEMFLESRMTNFKESDKIKHRFFMLLGGSGFGKTRMARELEKRARTRVPKKCQFRTAWIDFMNGQKLCPLDNQIKSPSAILGIRLLCTLLLGIRTEEFYGKVEKLSATEWASSLLEFLTVDVVMNLIKMHFEDEQCMILIVMDEINAMVLTLGQNKVKDMIASLASFICTSDKSKLLAVPTRDAQLNQIIIPKLPAASIYAAQINQIILPVICGTITNGILDAVNVSGFGRVEPSLQYLSKESIEFIYRAYFKEQLQLEYLKNEAFQRMLFYYGALPRSLEYFLVVIGNQNHLNFNDALTATANSIEEALNSWIKAKSFTTALSPSHSKDFLSLILSGHGERIMPGDQLQGLIRKAEQAGLAYYNGEELTLSPWQLRELAKATSLIGLYLLPRPEQPFYWQHFEVLEQELERVRVRSWKILKYENIKVAEFLRGARFESLGVFTREMKLPSDQYINEEDFQFALIDPKYVNLTHSKCCGIDIPLMASVLKCKTNNPLVDIRSAYAGNGGKPIMIVKQMKHSQKNQEETVPWVEVSHWFKQVQEKMTRLKYNTHYDIVYMFITNRRITNMPKTIDLELAVVSHENLSQYFGQSVALLAQLVSPNLN